MQGDDEFGQRSALPADRVDPRFTHELRPDLDRGEPEDRRRPGEKAADARNRVVGRSHRELLPLPEPAPDRRTQLLLQLPTHIEERGRAGTGVQVLVGAADREVDARRFELDRNDARGVAHVEQQERTGVVRGVGDRANIGERPRAIRDVRDAHDGHVAPGTRALDVSRRRPVGHVRLEDDELAEPFEDVAVGREVVDVRHERTRLARECGGSELEQVHGRRVAHEHLAAIRAEHRLGEQVAHLERAIDPVRPGGHEPRAPRVDDAAQPLDRRFRKPPERVAVRVDDRPLDHETLPEVRKRIRAVERLGFGSRHGSRSTIADQLSDAGSRHSKWPSSVSTSSTSSPVCAGLLRIRAAHLGGHRIVAAPVDEKLGDAERQPCRRRGERVPVGNLVRGAAEKRLGRTAAEAEPPGLDEVDDARL